MKRVRAKESGPKGMRERKLLKSGSAIESHVDIDDLAFETNNSGNRKRKGTGKRGRFLACSPRTSTDGYWDNSTAPVLSIDSGDVMEIETGTHLMGRMAPGTDINDWMRWFKDVISKSQETHTYPDPWTGAQKIKRGAGHHHLTGPIYINGAEPGDILQIEILDIVPAAFGFNLNPETSFMNQGLLAEDYPHGKVRWYEVDFKKMKFEFLPGIEIPVRPFPGTLGVELPDAGMWSNAPPGRHGGNLDNKDLIAGTVLYLPVGVKGAGLKTGDSHLAQGHGEVNLNALEGAFQNMKLRVTVRKDLTDLIDWPMGSSSTHWIMMGIHTDLLESCKMAVRKSISFLHKYYGLPEMEAYAFCSMAVDLQVTQVVNYTLGIHAMIPKACFAGSQYAKKNTLLLQA